MKLPRIPEVQEATPAQAVSGKVLEICVITAGLIGIVQGFVLGLMDRETHSLSEALLSMGILGAYGALIGTVGGGTWGFLLYLLFLRKTLTNEIFYAIAVVSLLTGICGALFFHFVFRDAQLISIYLIPIGTLFGAVAMRIRLDLRSR